MLKWSKYRPHESGSMMGVEAELGSFGSKLSFTESQNDNGASGINYGSAHSPISDGAKLSNSGRSRSKPLGNAGGGGGMGGMRFLKSGLKKAQQSFERSVTTMVIKADGGKNRDQMCVSLHRRPPMSEGGRRWRCQRRGRQGWLERECEFFFSSPPPRIVINLLTNNLFRSKCRGRKIRQWMGGGGEEELLV